jgi:hypothetical protein
MWLDFLICGLIGGLVGAGELVSRYRDDPMRALLSASAVIYAGMNVLASVAALGLIRAMDWRFGAAEGSSTLRWLQILIGGFGALALFRTSLFMVRIGNQEIGVGPVSFLQVVLDAADRGVDRRRARVRAKLVQRAMKGVSFESAAHALPTLCLALMQNASQEDQKLLSDQVDALRRDRNILPAVKVLALGLALMTFAGEPVLRAAVKSLGKEIQNLPGESPEHARSHGPKAASSQLKAAFDSAKVPPE